MSRVEYTWATTAPLKPDVYTTRCNESKYLTLRYWDGQTWFEIAATTSRGGTPFSWPKKSRSKRPTWAVRFQNSLRLRKISAYLGEIQWGEPFKVYDEKEVLAYLIKRGLLRSDWRTAFQEDMRARAGGAK